MYEKYIHKTEHYVQSSRAMQGRELHLHVDLQYEKHQYRFSGFRPFKNRPSLNTEEHSDAHISSCWFIKCAFRRGKEIQTFDTQHTFVHGLS